MYKGRLISELMATVGRAASCAQLQAKQSAEHERMDEELHALFSMQIPVTEGGQVFMGAA